RSESSRPRPHSPRIATRVQARSWVTVTWKSMRRLSLHLARSQCAQIDLQRLETRFAAASRAGTCGYRLRRLAAWNYARAESPRVEERAQSVARPQRRTDNLPLREKVARISGYVQ